MNLKTKFFLFFSAVIFFAIGLFVVPTSVYAQDSDICAVYFTGVGCPHCAKTDPVLLEQLVDQYPNLFIVEYEIYHQRENASLLYLYDEQYHSGLGIP